MNIHTCSSQEINTLDTTNYTIEDFENCPAMPVDSLSLNINMTVPNVITEYEDLLVLIDRIKTDSIFIVDFKSKKILRTLKVSGSGPFSAGSFAYSVGFLDRNNIVVSGANGYFFFDISSNNIEIEKRIYERLPQGWGGDSFKLYPILNQGDTVLISNRNAPFDITQFYSSNKSNTKTLIKKLRFLTLYDVRSQKISVEIPLEKNSKILSFEKEYGNFQQEWDYNFYNKQIASIINVDNYVNFYNVKNFTAPNVSLKSSMEIKPSCFRSEYYPDFGGEEKDPKKALLVNSSIVDLFSQKNLLIYTYLLGMPQDEYDQYKNEIALFEARNSRYYPPIHVIYENNKLKCKECILSPRLGEGIQLLDRNGFGYSVFNHEESSKQNGITIYKLKI